MQPPRLSQRKCQSGRHAACDELDAHARGPRTVDKWSIGVKVLPSSIDDDDSNSSWDEAPPIHRKRSGEVRGLGKWCGTQSPTEEALHIQVGECFLDQSDGLSPRVLGGKSVKKDEKKGQGIILTYHRLQLL